MARVSKQKMKELCLQLMQGQAIKNICKQKDMPSYMTFLRHVQEDEDAYDQYSKAQAIRAETMFDDIMQLVSEPLPEDKQVANAEVGRRRLQADMMEKYIRQLAGRGITTKFEDNALPGKITISWRDAEVSD